MRSLWFCLLLLLTGCSDERFPKPPVESTWQEGPQGWVYGRSPLHLSPAGAGEREGTAHLPDRIAFAYGSAELDFNGRAIALLQAQRFSQRLNYDGTLFCGWSTREEASLGAAKVSSLAAERCEAIAEIYRTFDNRIAAAVRLRRTPPLDAADMAAGAESFAVFTLVPSSRGRQSPNEDRHAKVVPTLFGGSEESLLFGGSEEYFPGIHFDDGSGIFLPLLLTFPKGSAELSVNASTHMKLIAEVTLPRSAQNIVLISCGQDVGEGGTAPADDELARRRCGTLRDFLIDQGVCEHRVVVGEGATWINPKGFRRLIDAKFSIYEQKNMDAFGGDC